MFGLVSAGVNLVLFPPGTRDRDLEQTNLYDGICVKLLTAHMYSIWDMKYTCVVIMQNVRVDLSWTRHSAVVLIFSLHLFTLPYVLRMCTTCVPGTGRGLKNILELVLQMAGNHTR